MAFNAIVPFSISTSGFSNSTWNTGVNIATLSGGLVPTNATGVIILGSYATGRTGVVGIRMNGSSDTYGANGAAPAASQFQLVGGLNSGECDIYLGSSALTGLSLECVGYFDSRATFLSTAVSLGSITTSYTTFTISGSVTGAVGAIISFGATPGLWGGRIGTTGTSSDNWENNAPAGGNGPYYTILGVDSNGDFMAATEGSSVTIYLLGWIRSGMVWNTNALNRTSSCTAGSSSLLPVETGASAYLYQMLSTSVSNTCQVGTSGASGLPTSPPTKGSGGQLVAGATPAANLSSTSTMSIYELAYFLPSGFPVPAFNLYGLKPTLAQ